MKHDEFGDRIKNMIEKLVETKTPSDYSDKVFKYSYHYEATEFKTIDDIIAHHKECKDYAVSYSGLSGHISYHFPAHVKGRKIYRVKFDGEMAVGIYTVNIKRY